jgi:Phytanoyl-CoA dioxygenase (PhyH)
VTSRRATETEVATWREDGWVLLDGLVGTDEIDALREELERVFPSAEELHADPEGVTERRLGRPVVPEEVFVWPDEGPGFRADQQRWGAVFPFAGAEALNRMCVHPSIVDFAERALQNTDIRLYQAHASAKYAGVTNYEQPMHIDRNHSWLPPGSESPWWNLEGFLYLTDVTADDNPTRLVTVGESAHIESPYGVVMPNMEPDVYEAERPAPGVRGSYLAYRSDCWHRGAPFGSATGARVVLAVAFKNAGVEWINYDVQQSRSTGIEWTVFVEGSNPRQLALFGWPAPGHPVWTERLIEQTQQRYPRLDLGPWRRALGTATRTAR